MTNPLQNNADWYSARLFHFTSSEVWRLLSKGRQAEITKIAEEYIMKKIAEEITAGTCLDYTQIETKQTRWGHEYEPYARTAYEERTGCTVELCGFIEWSPSFGGSPDGLVGDDGGIEIKCPYDTAVHARNLLLDSAEEFRKTRPEYYAQIQGNMLVSGRSWFDFVSFDPRVQNEKLQLSVLRVPRDDDYIQLIRDALDVADRIKDLYLEKLVKRIFSQNES